MIRLLVYRKVRWIEIEIRNTIKSRLLNRTLQNLLCVEDTFVEPPQVQGNQKEGNLASGIVHRTTLPNILTSFVSFSNSCSETAF